MKKTCLLATLIFFLFGGMNLSAQTEIPVAEDLYALSLFGLELDLKPKPNPRRRRRQGRRRRRRQGRRRRRRQGLRQKKVIEA